VTPIDLALDYAAAGWPVFPCDPENKRPLVATGFKAATEDQDRIRAWWQQFPAAMIGVPTGERSGVWVLDVDTKNGDGFGELADLETANDDLPETITVRTPSGGQHYLFRHVDGVRNRGRLTGNIDVRGDGGYVIAPGSVNSDGQFYEWVAQPPEPADAPDWLLGRVMRKDHDAPPRATPAPQRTINSRYVEAAVDAELADLASTPMGNRNNALNDSAFSLGTLVGAGAMSESDARDSLQHVARGWGRDWTQCCKTIENGLAAGIRAPRRIPEPSRNLGDEQLAAEGARIAARLLANNPRLPDAPDDLIPAPIIFATPYVWREPETLPRREWIYAQHYVRKYVSLTVAPGGVGKSSLAIAEALAMVTGRSLHNIAPTQGNLRVWYFNGEDDRDELDRRVQAVCLRFGITRDKIDGRLFIDSGREQQLVVMVEDQRKIRIATPVVEALIDAIKANKIDVLIVDPFVSTHAVSENDNGAIDKVTKLWAAIADETNCSIELIHHVKKTEGREISVEDARGASALLAAARVSRVINRMSEEQAKAADIPPSERYSYVSVEVGKSNMGPLSDARRWFRIESVSLGNFKDIQKPTDFVGVVAAWQWPAAEEAALAVAPDALEAILSRIGSGPYSENATAKDWAGHVVADVLEMDAGESAVKRKISRMLESWVSTGKLVVDRRNDPNANYRPRPFLTVPPPP
tara:strand:- start:3047 stop:5131 length:2085 start_codon:yes stop_codon:yes gene_type:complete